MASNNDTHQQQQQKKTKSATTASAAVPSNGGTGPNSHHGFDFPKFWQDQMTMVENSKPYMKKKKDHPIPLRCIKKIMKEDKNVKILSKEVLHLVSKGCEIFINELTERAFSQTKVAQRQKIRRNDVTTVISESDVYDFLSNIISRQKSSEKEDSSGDDQQEYNAVYFPPKGSQQTKTSYHPPISKPQLFSAQKHYRQRRPHTYPYPHPISGSHVYNRPHPSAVNQSRLDNAKHECE